MEAIGTVGRAASRAFSFRWQRSRPIMNLFVFSDGALVDGKAGGGFVVQRGLTQEVGRVIIPLGPSAEVYDAEVAAAISGLAAALQNPMARYATNFTVCLDNQEAVFRLLTGTPTATSSRQIQRFPGARIVLAKQMTPQTLWPRKPKKRVVKETTMLQFLNRAIKTFQI